MTNLPVIFTCKGRISRFRFQSKCKRSQANVQFLLHSLFECSTSALYSHDDQSDVIIYFPAATKCVNNYLRSQWHFSSWKGFSLMSIVVHQRAKRMNEWILTLYEITDWTVLFFRTGNSLVSLTSHIFLYVNSDEERNTKWLYTTKHMITWIVKGKQSWYKWERDKIGFDMTNRTTV